MACWWHCVLLALTVCTASAELAGGFEDASPSSRGVQQAASFAVAEYNKESTDEYASKMIKVLSAQIQVVAGMKYVLDVEMGLTQCKKGESNDVQSCALNTSDKKFMCHFVVLDVPWRSVTQLLESSCKLAPVAVLKASGEVVGGVEEVSPNRKDVQSAARSAVIEYNKQSTDENASKLIKVLSAQTQVVAGIKYILDVEIGLTQCKKGESNDVQSCALNTSGKRFTCHFVVLEVPWLDKTQLLDSSCKPSQG
ncbi:onchocystatin-like [Polyodon spathula]|uniref:onchocystatin-like n=1 Tax=Polyodon spathula TaxID=7913 RepID=UPI001B7F07A1|nr:onchocystatin-like [Polyodon spathula]